MRDSSPSDIATVLTDKAPEPAGHYVQATLRVSVPELHYGYLVEIDAVAAVNSK